MKLRTVLLGLTVAAVSGGVAMAQMQPIPNPPETPKAASSAKHHAKKHHAKTHRAARKTSPSKAAKTPAPGGAGDTTKGASGGTTTPAGNATPGGPR